MICYVICSATGGPLGTVMGNPQVLEGYPYPYPHRGYGFLQVQVKGFAGVAGQKTRY